MHATPNSTRKRLLIPLLSAAACLLLASCASTGLVLADLNSPGVKKQAAAVRKECNPKEVAQPWPVLKRDLTQAETESLARRDGKEGLDCSTVALGYVDTITKRDTALAKGKVGKKVRSK